MIRKVYNDLMPHVPAAVSPMIASGRAVKTLHPGALTIFIGPCMAKKAEAREKDIADAVDYVLTFKEVEDIFSAMDIDPAGMEENIKDHSSRAGRIYAHTGGVSEAVRSTVEKLDPGRKITVRTRQADGVAACKAMMNDLVAGSADANFFEGMGCVGGCIGGPRAILDREEGWKNVEEYAKDAVYETPLDNYYVIELLKRLGLDTIENLLLDNEIFTRKF
jgi:iron only hydrogenase large subunit-like protein